MKIVMANPVKVLYVNGGTMSPGGIVSFMMNYYLHIDKTKVHIDFLVADYKKGTYDNIIRENGSKIMTYPSKKKGYYNYINAIKMAMMSDDYQIVHSHLDAMNTLILKIAKQCGIAVRIAHSHNTHLLTNNPLKVLYNTWLLHQLDKYSTYNMACGKYAGRWLFRGRRFTIIPNAISLDKFSFSKENRKKIRDEYKIRENDIVIGHVGVFDNRKNHKFLVDVFQKIHVRYSNTKLILVGNGKNKEKIKKQVMDYGLSDFVIFTDTRLDANKIYSAMDIMFFPSKFEGFSLTMIEAQQCGLPIIASDRIDEEENINGAVSFLPLDVDKWVAKYIMLDLKEDNINMRARNIGLKKTAYDIEVSALNLQDLYINLSLNSNGI